MSYHPVNSPEIVHTLESATYWARGQALELNRAGTGFARMEDALFVPLDETSRQEFEHGDGGELSRMHSLRSSSALVFNVFAPWKPDPTPIANVLGGSGSYQTLGFERKYPTGVSSRHPHLDVVLDGAGLPIAVESKFVEIYDEPKPAQFSRRYLDASVLWAGMPNLKALATQLAANPMTFHRLGAAQLIKHTLGLARKYGPEGFRLIYLWYDFHSETAEIHRGELGRFTEVAGQDITFTSVTHQELFAELTQIKEPAPGYRRYLAGRYGLG
jgi:hypothetical protein